jgi:long-subunit acyl-CoA synthetase (AMP-forming)
MARRRATQGNHSGSEAPHVAPRSRTARRLRAIVSTLAPPPASARGGPGARVYTWSEFLALGTSVPAAALEARMNAQRPGHCCSLIYTSGTTGDPKAVMLSHDNLAYTCKVTNSVINAKPGDVIVSYLPLSHIAAQAVDMHGAVRCGGGGGGGGGLCVVTRRLVPSAAARR